METLIAGELKFSDECPVLGEYTNAIHPYTFLKMDCKGREDRPNDGCT
jgi:hypothetical protein